MMLMPGTYRFSLSAAANKLLWRSRYPVRIAACMLLALLAVVLFPGGKTMGRIVFLAFAFQFSPHGTKLLRSGRCISCTISTMLRGASSQVDAFAYVP